MPHAFWRYGWHLDSLSPEARDYLYSGHMSVWSVVLTSEALLTSCLRLPTTPLLPMFDQRLYSRVP